MVAIATTTKKDSEIIPNLSTENSSHYNLESIVEWNIGSRMLSIATHFPPFSASFAQGSGNGLAAIWTRVSPDSGGFFQSSCLTFSRDGHGNLCLYSW